MLYLWWFASPGAAADQPGVQDWYIPFSRYRSTAVVAVPTFAFCTFDAEQLIIRFLTFQRDP
jgi:hypothetical protein